MSPGKLPAEHEETALARYNRTRVNFREALIKAARERNSGLEEFWRNLDPESLNVPKIDEDLADLITRSPAHVAVFFNKMVERATSGRIPGGSTFVPDRNSLKDVVRAIELIDDRITREIGSLEISQAFKDLLNNDRIRALLAPDEDEQKQITD